MGRDHSIECEKCGASYGGFDGPDECDCSKCAACGHDRVFHQIGTGNGVPVGQEYCDDRHADPCSCTGFVEAPHVANLVLHCPKCGTLHLDVGEWRDRPHKTHMCLNEKCGHLFRPVEAHTRGVSPEDATAGDLVDSLHLTCSLEELRALLVGGREACGHLAMLTHYNGGGYECAVCGKETS